MFLYYATVPKSYRATTNCHHSSSVELSSFIFPFLCFGFIFHVCRLFVRCRLWLKLQFICQPLFFHQFLTPLIPIYVQLIHLSLLKNRHHPFIWQPSSRPQSHLSSYHLFPCSEKNKLLSSLILLSFLSLFCLLLLVTISLGYPHFSPVIHLPSSLTPSKWNTYPLHSGTSIYFG